MEKMTHVGLDVHQDSIAIAKLRPGSDNPLVCSVATGLRGAHFQRSHRCPDPRASRPSQT